MANKITQRNTIKEIIELYEEASGTSSFRHKRLVQERPNCFAEIVYRSTSNVTPVVGYGFSKVCYPDVWDADKGLTIAIDRALVDIGKKVYYQLYMDDLMAGANRAQDMFSLDELEVLASDLETAKERV